MAAATAFSLRHTTMRQLLRSTLAGIALLTGATAVTNAQPTQIAFQFSNSLSTSLLINGITTVSAAGRGWYDADGLSNGGSSTNNYAAGVCGPVACGGSGETVRNWFRFDLANFSPVATSAVLRLENPANGYFNELGSSLNYNLFDITGTFGTLGNSNSLAVFNDLGTGTQYGTTNITSAQNGTIIEIALNSAALASINSGRQGGFWAVGGNIATSVVPEPSTYVLMMAGLAGIAVAARAKRRVR